MKKVLFLCVANSARSQLAEGIAKHLFPDTLEVMSAGSEPQSLNPNAITVMDEIGIDISGHQSKSTGDLPKDFIANLDYVITLCAEEVCPILPSNAKKIHWPLSDPVDPSSSNREDQLQSFRQTRDDIYNRIQQFF